MAFYELKCKKCDHEYGISSLMSEMKENIKKAKCDKCGSKSKEKIISSPNFNFSNPVGTDRWNSDSTGHDYRFKHNIPNVQKERETAQALSHMGADPYGNADLSTNDIEMDTGIHDAEGPTMLTEFE